MPDTQPSAADDVPNAWRWGREFLGRHGGGQSVTVEDRRDAQCARGGRRKASREGDRRPLAEARGGQAKRESGEQAIDNTELTPLLGPLRGKADRPRRHSLSHHHTAARSRGPGVRIKIPRLFVAAEGPVALSFDSRRIPSFGARIRPPSWCIIIALVSGILIEGEPDANRTPEGDTPAVQRRTHASFGHNAVALAARGTVVSRIFRTFDQATASVCMSCG